MIIKKEDGGEEPTFASTDLGSSSASTAYRLYNLKVPSLSKLPALSL